MHIHAPTVFVSMCVCVCVSWKGNAILKRKACMGPGVGA